MASDKITHLGETTFDQTIKESQVPVLVDFWAIWCGPCRAVAPILEDLASEYDGKVKIGKVNVDENQELAIRYSIHSIPTLLFFRDGKVVDTVIGAVPKSQLKSAIDRVLSR